MSVPYIDPAQVVLELDGGEGYPQLGVMVRETFVTDPLRCDGMMDEVDPEEHWGIPDDFARAVSIINHHLRTWSEVGDMSLRRYVVAWTTDGYGDSLPEDVGIESFSASNGYAPHLIKKVTEMEVGDIVTDDDHGYNSHMIYRRK